MRKLPKVQRVETGLGRGLALGEWDAESLAVAADANLVVHASWAPRRLTGMNVLEGRGLVLVDSGLPCDTFNLVCGARLERDAAPQRIRETVAYFRDVGRPFSWWVGPADQPHDIGDLLVVEGLERAGCELAMAAELSELPDDELAPGGLTVERVASEEQLRDFASVVATNWTPADEQVLRFYLAAAPVLLAPGTALRLYVGYLEGIAVATSELTVGGGVVGLYGVCVVAAHRHRGIGRALTLKPLLDARREHQHTAILYASTAGVNVYAGIGFKSFGEVAEYKPIFASPAGEGNSPP